MRVRNAKPGDGALLYELICALAEYERQPSDVVTSPEILEAQLASSPPPFEALIIEDGSGDNVHALGFALFFPTYSTWRGQAGLWLEDFFVRPECRGRGAGNMLFQEIEKVAAVRGYGRLEFMVLNWNELAHRFYRKRDLAPMDDWSTWRKSY